MKRLSVPGLEKAPESFRCVLQLAAPIVSLDYDQARIGRCQPHFLLLNVIYLTKAGTIIEVMKKAFWRILLAFFVFSPA